MEDSPRSSKRRKIASGQRQSHQKPEPLTPSKFKNGSLKRATRDRTSRTAVDLLDAGEDPLNENETVPVEDSPAKFRTKDSTRKTSQHGTKRDVYDDIDGAHVGTTKRNGRRKPGPEESDELGSGSDEEEVIEAGRSPAKRNLTARLRAASRKDRNPKSPAVSNGHSDQSGGESRDNLRKYARRDPKTDFSAPQALDTCDNTRRSGGRRANRLSIVDMEDNSVSSTPSSTQQMYSGKKQKNGFVPAKSAIPKSTIVDSDHLETNSPSTGTRNRKASRKLQESDAIFMESPARHLPSRREAPQELSNGSFTEPSRSATQPSTVNRVNGIHTTLAGTPDTLTTLKHIVLSKLTQKRPIPLIGLEDEYFKVSQLVEQTVAAGEGNSMLVIGARGSGKSVLVDKVLIELSQKHGEEFHVVRLNGFIQTDDKLALREIWRQLGKEMEIADDSVAKNYADTLTTLLALLSHPSEADGQLTDQVAKSVVFVMDEFDLFATHPRQTLLYNLFDIAQSRKAPIAVLGLTTRIDVVESLEKRVKSRFSHRYVHLSLAKSFGGFIDICKAALAVQPEELSVEERRIILKSEGSMKTSKASKTGEHGNTRMAAWNDSIEKLFDDQDFTKTILAPQFHRSKSIPAMLASALLPVLSLSADEDFLTPANFQERLVTLQPPDSKLYLLAALSELQLALMISAARLDVILDTDTCNFNMAYAEYISLASKARIQSAAGGAIAAGAGTKVWGKDVARGEWESLIELELLLPVAGSAGGANAMVRVDVALEEIAPSVPGLDRLMDKWCRTI